MNPPAVFVYGTLRRGEERAGRWPRQPMHVEWATIRGRLHDLGPYPALVPGEELVLGELWHLAPHDLAETLKVLDEIECYGNEDVDLYVRSVIDCTTLDGRMVLAHVYFFANPAEIAETPIVQCDEQGYCLWQRAAP